MIIYKITNTINDRVYIGQTIRSLPERWRCHKHDAKCRRKPYPLYNAMNKYGIENFTIEEIGGANNISELNYQEWLSIHKNNTLWPNGYNMKIGGNGAVLSNFRTNKKVINIETGEIWISAKECANRLGLKICTLRDKLRGRNINSTPLRYIGMEHICKKIKEKKLKPKIVRTKMNSQEFLEKMIVINKKIAKKRFSKKFNVYHAICVKNKGWQTAAKFEKGDLVGKWELKRDCAKSLNIHESGISAALLGRVNVNKGYIFEYEVGCER